jgi:hypothetical protein
VVDADETYPIEGPFNDLAAYTLTQVQWSGSNEGQIVSRNSLKNYAMEITKNSPLRRGIPASGWLHFKVEHGVELRSLSLDGIRSINLIAYDAFSNLHTGHKDSPLDNPSTLISQTGVSL